MDYDQANRVNTSNNSVFNKLIVFYYGNKQYLNDDFNHINTQKLCQKNLTGNRSGIGTLPLYSIAHKLQPYYASIK